MTKTTEKVNVGHKSGVSIRPVVVASIAACTLGVAMTYLGLYFTRPEQDSHQPSASPSSSPSLSSPPSSSPSSSSLSPECTLHYHNVGWGPEPELYIEREDTKYFRQIDGQDIGELVKLMGAP